MIAVKVYPVSLLDRTDEGDVKMGYTNDHRIIHKFSSAVYVYDDSSSISKLRDDQQDIEGG